MLCKFEFVRIQRLRVGHWFNTYTKTIDLVQLEVLKSYRFIHISALHSSVKHRYRNISGNTESNYIYKRYHPNCNKQYSVRLTIIGANSVVDFTVVAD